MPIASKKNEQALVVEQKGMRVLIVGLLIAAFLGLMIRAMFSPARMLYEVEKIITNSQARADIKVKGAYLSLVSGIWPRVAVVVEGISIHTKDPTNPCFSGFDLGIESLEVPAALSSLWERRFIVSQIIIHKAQVLAPSIDINCRSGAGGALSPVEEKKVSANTEITQITGITPGSSPVAPIVQTISFEKPRLEKVLIDEVLIGVKSRPELNLAFSDIEVNVLSQEEQKFNAEGKLRFYHQVFSESQGPSAKIKLSVDRHKVESNVSGVWKVGSFDVWSIFDRQKQVADVKGELRYLPVNYMAALFGFYGAGTNLPKVQSSWLSLKFEGNSDIVKHEEGLNIQDLKWDGDFGELHADKINLKHINGDLKWQAFSLTTKEISVDELMAALGILDPLPQIAKWGSLEANIEVKQDSSLNMTAKGRDLGVIFSSRGKREIQKINSYELKLLHRENLLQARVSNIQAQDATIEGQIDLEKTKQNSFFKLNFSKIRLAQRVRDILSHRGELGLIHLKADGELSEGKLHRVEGELALDHGLIDGILIDDLKSRFESLGGGVKYQVTMQQVALGEKSVITQVFDPINANSQGLSFKKVKGEFVKTDVSLVAQFFGQLMGQEFKFTGGWENMNQLSGEFSLSRKKVVERYVLVGTREKPELKPINGIK